jgi:hypothetical protein
VIKIVTGRFPSSVLLLPNHFRGLSTKSPFNILPLQLSMEDTTTDGLEESSKSLYPSVDMI